MPISNSCRGDRDTRGAQTGRDGDARGDSLRGSPAVWREGIRIIDQAAEPGTTSRALGVQARTLEFYHQVAIAGAVVEAGVRSAALNLWVRGAEATRVPLQRIGQGLTPFPFFLVFPQDAHERLLIERLEALGVTVDRQTELVRFHQQRDNVWAVLKGPDGLEQVSEVAFLAGCDGAHSTVRQALEIGFPGGAYSQLFYVADVEAGGPATDGDLHVDLDQAELLAVFPMKGRGRVRLIGTVREEPGADGHELSFDTVRGRAVEHLRLGVERVNWFSTYHVHHRVAHRFREGRVFLLGDAAHIHSPVGAQGMNTGIGDAVNLAWKLAGVLSGGAGDGLLDTYELERMRFARRLVATTDRVFTVATKQGPIADRVRTVLVPAVMPWLLRLPPVRRFVFRTVSQIGIAYPTSPLSAGAAGAVRGGNRLPWVQTGANEDNFAPLTALTWQVHVYGEPAPGLLQTCVHLGLPLRGFGWRAEMERAGLMRGALYLVRPDGYVALAVPDSDPEQVAHYLMERGLSCPSAPT